MAHLLQIVNGEAVMAYNKDNGVPWHKLGQPVAGLQKAEEIEEVLPLAFAQVDLREVFIQEDPILTVNELGEFIESPGKFVAIPNRYATTRVHPESLQREAFEVFKSRYTVIQNAEVLQDCLDIVGASHGDAVIETIGCLEDGRKFFVCLDLGSLMIDPAGIKDEIAQYLLGWSSHDGSMPETFANTPIRVVCNNTAHMAMNDAKTTFAIRHTPEHAARKQQAQAALGMSTKWAEKFAAQAEQMLAVPMGHGRLNTVLNRVWPEKEEQTDRQKANREKRNSKVHELFDNGRNALRVGENGWAGFGAVTEWLDHFSHKNAATRAENSMTLTSTVSHYKERTAAEILSLV
jgi:phage/plasmid-like protein (TIGR03299 family)